MKVSFVALLLFLANGATTAEQDHAQVAESFLSPDGATQESGRGRDDRSESIARRLAELANTFTHNETDVNATASNETEAPLSAEDIKAQGAAETEVTATGKALGVEVLETESPTDAPTDAPSSAPTTTTAEEATASGEASSGFRGKLGVAEHMQHQKVSLKFSEPVDVAMRLQNSTERLQNSTEEEKEYKIAARTGEDVAGRIVFGEPPGTGMYPYYVAVVDGARRRMQVGTGAGQCGGTLIAPRVVLTAASCLNAEQTLGQQIFTLVGRQVRVGAYFTVNSPNFGQDGSRSATVVDQVIHPAYTQIPTTDGTFGTVYRNDIMLLKLKDDVYPDQRKQKVALSNRRSDVNAGNLITIIGMGTEALVSDEFPETLLEGTYTLPSPGQCFAEYEAGFFDFETQICTGDVDDSTPCTGDAGGPHILIKGDTHYVVGVDSRGDCIDYSLATKIPTNEISGYDWIVDQVCKEWRLQGFRDPDCGPNLCDDIIDDGVTLFLCDYDDDCFEEFGEFCGCVSEEDLEEALGDDWEEIIYYDHDDDYDDDDYYYRRLDEKKQAPAYLHRSLSAEKAAETEEVDEEYVRSLSLPSFIQNKDKEQTPVQVRQRKLSSKSSSRSGEGEGEGEGGGEKGSKSEGSKGGKSSKGGGCRSDEVGLCFFEDDRRRKR